MRTSVITAARFENEIIRKSILKAKYLLKTILWVLSGYLGSNLLLRRSSIKVTVVITYFDLERMKQINHQVRNILKCRFVEKIVILNHNIDVRIEDLLKIKDNRLAVVNQTIKRGCGFRWLVASEFNPEYLIVIDDDMLLFSWQLAKLADHLINEPDVPHGLSGMRHLNNGYLEFHDRENISVEFLCETYALTRDHLRRYLELREHIITNDTVAEIIDSMADFLLISQTGHGKPKIHDAGYLFRHETFDKEGVAIHKNETFELKLQVALNELAALDLLHLQ